MYLEKFNKWPFIDTPWDLLIPCETNGTEKNMQRLASCATSHVLGILSGYVYPFVGTFGILSNFLICYIFLIRYPPKYRTRQIIYLSALALADNFCLISFGWLWIFPAKGLPYMTEGNSFFFTFNESNNACKVHRYIYSFASTLAVNLFLLTSVDRCLSIYKPLKYSKKGKTFAWTLIAITTVVSGIIVIPFGIIINLHMNIDKRMICWIDNSNLVMIGQLCHVLFSNCGFAQTVAIVTVNLSLLLKLKNAQELRKELCNHVGSATKEISACTLLVVLSIIFVLGSLPQTVAYMFAVYFQTIKGATELVRLSYNFSDIGWHLFFIQEATNWFVYMARMKNFRYHNLCMMRCKEVYLSNSTKETQKNKMNDYEVTELSKSVYNKNKV